MTDSDYRRALDGLEGDFETWRALTDRLANTFKGAADLAYYSDDGPDDQCSRWADFFSDVSERVHGLDLPWS